MHLSDLTPKERRELAQKAGTNPVYLWQVATGRRNVSPEMAKRLVAADPRLTLAKLRPDIWGDGIGEPGAIPQCHDPSAPNGEAGDESATDAETSAGASECISGMAT